MGPRPVDDGEARRETREGGERRRPRAGSHQESVLVASDRLVFVSYDEQLYKDLKAHQDKRVAKMQRKK